jgi:hypothetical protein
MVPWYMAKTLAAGLGGGQMGGGDCRAAEKSWRVETQAQTFKPTLSHRKLAHLAQTSPSRNPARLSEFLIHRSMQNASGISGVFEREQRGETLGTPKEDSMLNSPLSNLLIRQETASRHSVVPMGRSLDSQLESC